jgi:DNA-binding MarR family transcriptional regulator
VKAPEQEVDLDSLRQTPSAAAAAELSYAVYRLARAHREYARRLLEQVGLYPVQELLLMQLWDREPSDQSELGVALNIERPTVTKMLQRMEQQGLVVRERLSTNRRRVMVSCTAKGRRLRPLIERMWDEIETGTTALLDHEERDEALRLVLLLTAGIEAVTRPEKTPPE